MKACEMYNSAESALRLENVENWTQKLFWPSDNPLPFYFLIYFHGSLQIFKLHSCCQTKYSQHIIDSHYISICEKLDYGEILMIWNIWLRIFLFTLLCPREHFFMLPSLQHPWVPQSAPPPHVLVESGCVDTSPVYSLHKCVQCCLLTPLPTSG